MLAVDIIRIVGIVAILASIWWLRKLSEDKRPRAAKMAMPLALAGWMAFTVGTVIDWIADPPNWLTLGAMFLILVIWGAYHISSTARSAVDRATAVKSILAATFRVARRWEERGWLSEPLGARGFVLGIVVFAWLATALTLASVASYPNWMGATGLLLGAAVWAAFPSVDSLKDAQRATPEV